MFNIFDIPFEIIVQLEADQVVVLFLFMSIIFVQPVGIYHVCVVFCVCSVSVLFLSRG